MARQPNDFQRWIAAHALGYVALVLGGSLLVASGSLLSGDGLIALIAGLMIVLFVLAAWCGALLARRSVRRYDARTAP